MFFNNYLPYQHNFYVRTIFLPWEWIGLKLDFYLEDVCLCTFYFARQNFRKAYLKEKILIGNDWKCLFSEVNMEGDFF